MYTGYVNNQVFHIQCKHHIQKKIRTRLRDITVHVQAIIEMT